MQLLEVKNLPTSFHIGVGTVQAVRHVSFRLDMGESLGVVGESGSGKSVTMLSVMGLLPKNAEVTADVIRFSGIDMQRLDASEFRKIRGGDIGMIFQDPMTSLNPLYTVENQLTEPLRIHRKMSKAEARKTALDLLRRVDIPNPEQRLSQYPHEFSGGMRQRVMIAMAVACQPKLGIRDEPATALVGTIPAKVLELLDQLKKNTSTSFTMITRDLGGIASMCRRILVMYGGLVCEQGTAREIFYEPKHPYTWGLLHSIPKITQQKGEKLIPINGTPPDMLRPPRGCPFAPRCPYALPVCRQYLAPDAVLSDTHVVACHLMHPKAPKIERQV